MNKLYVPALFLALVGSSAFGQTAETSGKVLNARKTRNADLSAPSRPAALGGDRDVIWSNDLSDASSWSTSQATGASPDAWVIGTNGPAGGFPTPVIASTTAANGFALFDSDLLCGRNQDAFLTLVDPVDLSGYNGVILQFEQHFRRFRGDTYVGVSTDGSTWEYIEVNAEIAGNSSTANPDLEQVNLSALAGNQSQVWVRFRYFSTEAEHGSGAGCDYAWMVDDVAFVTLPDNEIKLNFGYVSTTGVGEEYGRIPVSQLPSALNVGAEVFNFGGQDQNNVSLTTTFSGPTAISEVVSNLGTIASQATATADENVSIAGLALGEYTVEYTVTSDEIDLDLDPANNTLLRNFEVTQNIYSLDKIGGHATGVTEVLQQIGSASFSDNTGLKMMNMYFITSPITVYGIEVQMSVNSRVGGQIRVSLLDTADVLSTPSETTIYVAGSLSDWHTLTAADVAAGVVTIEFPAPVDLTPNAYYACAEVSGSGSLDITTDPEVFILDDLTVAQPGLASAIWLPIDWNDETGTEGPHFYGGNGTAFAIRLSSNSSISVGENKDLAGVSIFPNPTNGIVTINTMETGRHTIEVTNTLGEIVMTTSINGTNTMDMSKLSKGVYSVRIANGTRSTVQRVILH